jgi:hypothetical protein
MSHGFRTSDWERNPTFWEKSAKFCLAVAARWAWSASRTSPMKATRLFRGFYPRALTMAIHVNLHVPELRLGASVGDTVFVTDRGVELPSRFERGLFMA